MSQAPDVPSRSIDVSVVVPLKNEEGNVAPLLAEIVTALDFYVSQPEKFASCAQAAASGQAQALANQPAPGNPTPAPPQTYEVIFIDDASSDETAVIVRNLQASYPVVRLLRHQTGGGQSAAIRSGVQAAHGRIIATLDGDGQNDPAFLPAMIAKLEAGGGQVGLVQGQRVGRKDTPFKRLQSRIANAVRGALLRDGTRDTGCGLKVFWRSTYLALPYFDALHRFMPALVVREGFTIAHHDVRDRPRGSGESKYGFWGRLRVGVFDLLGVWWLICRKKPSPVLLPQDGV